MIRYFRQKIDFLACIAMVLMATTMTVTAQSPEMRDFRHIDSNIRIYPKSQLINPVLLVKELVTGLSDSTEQVRAIYTWIAKNISYDLAAYRSSTKANNLPDEVLEARKAICSGYSGLFERLCELAGIEAVVITGYAKGYGYTPYTKFLSSNHAWNAVFLDNEWHFLDVTWAAGPPKEISGHHPQTDLDGYFFISPEKLIKTHLPEDPIWQLQDEKISLAEFETGSGGQNKLTDITNDAQETTPLNEFDNDIIGYKRSLNFNPRNESLRARLSFAYVYKAIYITDALWKLQYTELTDTLDGLETIFLAYLDSAETTIGISINLKNQAIIDDEANYQKGVFYYELSANIFEKANKAQGVSPDDRMSIEGFFTKSEGHFKSVPSESIYYPYAQKYLGDIADYRMKKKD